MLSRSRKSAAGLWPGRFVEPTAITALLVAVTLTVVAPSLSAQERSYDDVVPASAQTDPGLFDVHRVDDRVLFEIPDSVLGRDMAVMSRIAQAPTV